MSAISVKRGLTAMATAVAALGFALSGPATGTAQAAASDCPSYRVCLWQHSDYRGDWKVYNTGARVSNLGGFNDRTSSVYNHTNERYCLFENADYSGNRVYIHHGDQVRDLARLGFNDKTSSLKPC